MIDHQLNMIRQDFDAGVISGAQFIERLNATLSAASDIPDSAKIAAFDTLALNLAQMFSITHPNDLKNGVVALSSDVPHFAFEKTLAAIFGDKVFDFYNRTYEGQ